MQMKQYQMTLPILSLGLLVQLIVLMIGNPGLLSLLSSSRFYFVLKRQNLFDSYENRNFLLICKSFKCDVVRYGSEIHRIDVTFQLITQKVKINLREQ